MYVDVITGSARDADAACPNCGDCNVDDNRLSERLYAEAATEAPRLRHEGRADEALDVLSAYYALRIINFMRHRWLCLTCGVQFDG